MSYVRVESSVPRHRKFLKAGPAPSWLWLCGLAYCQEGLTNGFIPEEALTSLGVPKNAPYLAERLVKAGLWDLVSGGWMVHDYLEHNRSSEQVGDLKAKRKKAGEAGGRPPKANGKANDDTVAFECESNAVAVAVDAVALVLPSEEKKVKKRIGARDVWFRELYDRYPENRRQRGRIVEGLFNDVFSSDERPDESVWSDMCLSLQSALEGYEWRVKGMVPKLENWLVNGNCFQRHERAPAEALVSPKTARTLSSLEQFVKDGTNDAH
ncbi:MAG: hypothetical protein RLZZ373_861 [Pseudomonadota bacterium]|jgi:hypothetical protein